ncbi:FMN-binding negative transcriptional regulator [Hyphomonas johnsonii]|uniref:Putative FMN-binding protein n=1 Tax=Hyphomonas johnsonii MHS-2 TaxID=1280950 RepID=A0A059FFV0_9PROT|nr:FMN-binding negative transcriptional regulator [Hyphomonas johnsonii]KCZ89494.1 putative FMN-binding protein [Hyphomonas johnsonii MHS-2]
MHPARHFLDTRIQTLVARARAHPFALVCASDGTHVHAAHAPVLLDETDDLPVLRFHLSAGNAVTAALLAGNRSLVVFTGDHAYVSPDWYGLPDQVGTWNYLSVEAEGPVTHLDKAGSTRLLDDLSDLFESGLAPKPAWTRARMTPGRFDAMLPGIRAFSLVPSRFEGITKLSQNKPQSAQDGVIAALSERDEGIAIANHMRKLSS